VDHTPFTLDTLGDLDDGTVRLMIDKAIAEALDDCDARPSLAKDRSVAITLTLTPVLNSMGGMKGVDAQVSVKTGLPARKGNADYLPTTVRADGVTAYLPTDRQDAMFQPERARAEEVS
jgi:hypothetical protein